MGAFHYRKAVLPCCMFLNCLAAVLPQAVSIINRDKNNYFFIICLHLVFAFLMYQVFYYTIGRCLPDYFTARGTSAPLDKNIHHPFDLPGNPLLQIKFYLLPRHLKTNHYMTAARSLIFRRFLHNHRNRMPFHHR